MNFNSTRREQMNYQRHYDLLMERAKMRCLEGYTETHHILPRCLGGTNDKNNLAVLTPEEHYVEQQLLVKLYPDNTKLLWAASNMTGNTRTHARNNKLYGWLRRKLAEKMRTRIISPETRAKLSQSKQGQGRAAGFSH